MSTVLVTGASGFTGHHVALHAAACGLTVRATDVSSRFYGPAFEARGIEFVAADLTRREGLDALVDGIDAVVHVAGIHDYSTPEALMVAVNVDAVDNMCRAATDAGVKRFVHFSSVGVYGYDWHGKSPVPEDAPKLTPPLNHYNVTKWEGEKAVHRYGERGLPAVVLRPAAIYGPRAEYGLFNVFKQVRKERDKSRMLMVGAGDCAEAFVHVDDVCRAVMHALDTDAMVGEAFNVSDDSRITTAEFFNLVCKELYGVEKRFIHVPKTALLPVAAASQLAARVLGHKSLLEVATLHYLTHDRIWDNTKLKATGFELSYPTIQSGLGGTLRWYRDNGWL
jgi:nucleoside-diphosphate-sugar epimerase